VHDNATALFRAIKEGWGSDIEGMEYASLEHRTLLQLRYSAHVTAVFKNHHNSLEVARLLFDDKGELRPFRQFQTEALKIMDSYNRAYLQSEYQTAVQTATHAAQWDKYQRRGGSLVLRTQGDGRVRNEHRLYNGATYPVGDDFWNTWYPPNGWRCRCFVTWKADEQAVDPEGLPTIQDGFKHNAGKAGTIFGDDHPYFEVSTGWAQRSKDLFGYKPPLDPERVEANFGLYERLEKAPNYNRIGVDNLSGGVAYAHKQHDQKDYPSNRKAARAMAGEGNGVVIREHVQTDGVKNPELEVNGELSDLKTPQKNTAGSVKNQFRRSYKQGIETIVIDTGAVTSDSMLVQGLKDGFHFYPSIKFVYLLRKGNIIEVSRKDYEIDIIEDKVK